MDTKKNKQDRAKINDVLFVKYILASYLYYDRNFSVMSDHEYDQLCMELEMMFDGVTHWAKYLVDRETLKAGSGYNLHHRVPGALVGMANYWRREVERAK